MEHTFFERLNLAMKLEAIQQDICPAQKIAAIKARCHQQAKALNWDDLTKEEIIQVVAIRALNNCYQPKRTHNNNG
jgi:hypothetical protein